MSLALVARSARALSEHLNRYYRVFKGIDPESVVLRLPGSGSFEVRHSTTNAALFTVNDAGVNLTGTIALPANSITTGMIANGTIKGEDIQGATITPDKLTGASGVPADAITTVELADNAVQTANILANAASQTGYVYSGTLGQEGTAGSYFDLPGMSVALTTTGAPILILASLALVNSVANQAVLIASNVDNGAEQVIIETATSSLANTRTNFAYVARLPGVTANAHTFKLRWRIGGGTMGSYERSMLVVELKR